MIDINGINFVFVVININILMIQDQNMSSSPSIDLNSQDSFLQNLFQQVQKQADFPIFQEQRPSIPYGDIVVRIQDMQKGYASQEEPNKQPKRKMIGRKKPNFIKENSSKQMRSKLYIESLQNRIIELESQVQKLRGINKLNVQYIKKINDSQLIINGFFMDRQKILQRIQKLTNNPNPDQRRIRMQCLALRAKQGADGQDRIKAIDYYFKQLVEMIVPNSHRYLTHAALSNSDVFNSASFNSAEQWRKQLFRQINFSEEALSFISLSRKQIIDVQETMKNKLDEMQKNTKELMEMTKQIDVILNKINQFLTPLQTGLFFIYLQKYKFQSNFSAEYSVKKLYDEYVEKSQILNEQNNIQIE